MSISSIVAAVVVTVLSVIGLMALVRAGLGALWSPREVAVAVVLRASEGMPPPEMLDLYLGEAVRHPARRRAQSPIVLVAASLVPAGGVWDEELAMILERYGATVVWAADADLES